MNKSITVELQFFLISIIAGAIILLIYDGLRIMRRLISHNIFLLAVQDLIFWVAASVFIFSMMYQKNDGIIRGFSIMGMAIGMTLYHYILSEWLINMITKLIKLILSPILLAFKWVKRLFLFVHKKLKKISKYLLLQLKKIIKSFKIKIDKKKKKKALLRADQKKEKLKNQKEQNDKKQLNNKKQTNNKKQLNNKKKDLNASKKKDQNTSEKSGKLKKSEQVI